MKEKSSRSKYEKLSEAYEKSRKTFLSYREEALAFATALYGGLSKFLEAPAGSMLPVAADEKGDYAPVIPLGSALVMTSENYWYFGVGFVFNGQLSDTSRSDMSVLHILFKDANESTYAVRLGVEGEDFNVRKGNQEDLAAFYEHLFEQAVKGFDEEMASIMKREEKKPIGFR